MDKYALLKMFHHHRIIQVYVYAFVYINSETIPVKAYFTATKTFVKNYKKISIPVTGVQFRAFRRL